MLEYIDSQLADWPFALKNYQALGQTERRCLQIGDLQVGIQHNPSRIVSTSAKTDAASLASRPCFLCRENRPVMQKSMDFIDGWDFLINPYPIFPSHFTIVSKLHEPQDGCPIDMVTMAEKLPGHTIFFNGKHAGASCPDHLHCQAVKTDELPLMKLIEKKHCPEILDGNKNSSVADVESLGLDMPFNFKSVIITADISGMYILGHIEDVIGRNYLKEGKINVFVWIDDLGLLRIVGVPRNAHRPSCYGSDDFQHLVSPGCIDMAGVIITPLKKDYDSLAKDEIIKIYKECGVSSL